MAKKYQPMSKEEKQAKAAAKKAEFKADVEKIAADIVAAMQAGPQQWRKAWKATLGGCAFNGQSKTGYRGRNRVRLAWVMREHGYTDSRFFSFKQVSDLGGKVKKGEHGFTVEHWLWAKDDKTGEPRPVQVRYYTVFNAQQCENIPEYVQPANDWNECERAENLIKASGVSFSNDGGDSAYYQPFTDSIHMPGKEGFPTASAYYATALHELGHSTGARKRCSRDLSGGFGSESYAKEELRAEIIALMLCQELGLEPPEMDKQHIAYLQSWSKVIKQAPEEILNAVQDAEKAIDWLFKAEEAAGLAPKKEASAEETAA